MAAAAAAREGAAVLLIEAKTRIGEQPHCGEFVPLQLFRAWTVDRGCITQRVERMETFIIDLDTSGDPLEIPCPAAGFSAQGFVIDRVRFDRDLARDAAALGATVLAGARLVGRQDNSWIVLQRGEKFSIRPRFIIAADGAASTVAALQGMARPAFLRGVQKEVPLVRSLDRTLVFLCRELVCGYGWLFPKGKAANVGLGMIPRPDVRPSGLLEKLLDRLCLGGIIRPGSFARSGGLIPVSGIRETLVVDNVLFCGDAAGLTHPVTGAGIPQAVISGDMAGRGAALALRTGKSQPLIEYETEIKRQYGGVIAHALSKRNLMTRRWNDTDFEETCRQTWIAFKGYRKRERGVT
jgi:geranylgeranyl reductase family protein